MVYKMGRFVNNLSITRGSCNGIKFLFNIWYRVPSNIWYQALFVLFKFQSQNLSTELLRGPGLYSISPEFNEIILMYKQSKTTDISKKLHNW